MKIQSYLFIIVVLVGSAFQIEALRRRLPKGKKEIHEGMVLSSTAFPNDGQIPVIYTCDGEEISPPLRWVHPPKGTKSFVLFCDDLDKPGGGKFNHWIVYNLPATVNHLPLNANIEFYKGKEGMNSYDTMGWSGPCPLIKPHRYRFTLFALSIKELKFTTKKPTRAMIAQAIKDHVLASATLLGTYDKEKNKQFI